MKIKLLGAFAAGLLLASGGAALADRDGNNDSGSGLSPSSIPTGNDRSGGIRSGNFAPYGPYGSYADPRYPAYAAPRDAWGRPLR